MVGSSLAVAAAAALIAFGSLAEQAGLRGLAAGGLQPAQPERAGNGGRAITVPAPSTAPPEDPREALVELVRETIARDQAVRTPQPRPAIEFTPAPRDRGRPDRDLIENQARVAVVDDELETTQAGGPPYGHAYGHYKNKHKDRAPKPSKRKDDSKDGHQDAPVYARTANDDEAGDSPKAPKMKKVKPAKGNGNGNGKAKGHAKHHGKAKGKGKGHAKHGG